MGVYLDLETNLTDALLISAAVRGEDYSDFGQTTTGKISARYDFADWFALRGSVQNGFRAPSLQQQYFATTSTNFINGVPFEITTFPVTDPVAVALGAQPLDGRGIAQLFGRRCSPPRRSRPDDRRATASTSTTASCCRKT